MANPDPLPRWRLVDVSDPDTTLEASDSDFKHMLFMYPPPVGTVLLYRDESGRAHTCKVKAALWNCIQGKVDVAVEEIGSSEDAIDTWRKLGGAV